MNYRAIVIVKGKLVWPSNKAVSDDEISDGFVADPEYMALLAKNTQLGNRDKARLLKASQPPKKEKAADVETDEPEVTKPSMFTKPAVKKPTTSK